MKESAKQKASAAARKPGAAAGRSKAEGGKAKAVAGKAKSFAGKVKSAAPFTVDEYLAGLPDDRREAIATLRKVIVKNLPKGYSETTGFGMICYGVPLETYPDTYNGKPLCYLALASQKNHLALYAMALYSDREKERWFREEFRKAGKKLDMGKSCIRFKSPGDLPLGVIGKMVAGTSVKDFIATYERIKK
jgi:hypothetical protein